MISACACMGPRPGDEYCYCQLKSRGMSVAHYEPTAEQKAKLDAVLREMCADESISQSQTKEGK